MYRPISLLCILSKVLESVIYNKIINFVWPKINNNQFGFLRNRSCLTQLLTSYSNVYSALDAGICCDIAYFDFKKAFDTVPHHEPLLKFWVIGITGLWFNDYLKITSIMSAFVENHHPYFQFCQECPRVVSYALSFPCICQ